MTKQQPNPSKTTLYGGLFVMLLLTITALGYFVYTLADLVKNINDMPLSIAFDKGSFYMPGVVLGLAMLIFAAVYESVFRKEMTALIASRCTRTGIAAVLLMFVLPQLAQYTVDGYLTQRDYISCDEASHQWLHAKTLVYVSEQSVCEKITALKQYKN